MASPNISAPFFRANKVTSEPPSGSRENEMLGHSCTEAQGLWEGKACCGLHGSTDGAHRLKIRWEEARESVSPFQAVEMAAIYSHLYLQTSKGDEKRHPYLDAGAT